MFWKIFKQGIWQGAVLVVIAAVLALGVNALRKDGLPLLPRPATNKAGPGRATDISLPEAFKLHTKQGALFVDARENFDFIVGHIPGALNAPPGKGAGVVGQLKAQPDRLIITYCSDPQCGLADKLATELAQAGLTNVRIMREGWLAWSNAGYPVQGQSRTEQKRRASKRPWGNLS